jgi:RNA polymerase sigma-70 factor, ECF subfamily
MTIHRDGPSTSLSMLERVRENDAAAWGRFCQVYGPLIYRWARYAGLQDSDAADVGQEVLQTVVHKIHAYDSQRANATLRGWLRVVTRNKLGDFLRRKASHHQAIGGSTAWQVREQIPESDLSAIDQPLPGEEQQIVHRMLETLKCEFEPRTWQAFWLATIDDWSVADIGQRLRMSPTAVRQAKFRVLRRLRDELGADFAGSPLR